MRWMCFCCIYGLVIPLWGCQVYCGKNWTKESFSLYGKYLVILVFESKKVFIMNSENSEPKVLKAGIFKIISLKVYPMTLFLSIGQTDEELKKCARKHFKFMEGFIEDSFKDWEGQSGIKARVLMHDSGDSLMRFKTGREIPNTIAHECFHIVNHVMTTIGGPLTESSEESWAYLLGYLVEEVTNEFRALAAKNKIEDVAPIVKLNPVLKLVPTNTK